MVDLKSDWGKVFLSFQATEAEASAAADCYALGHNTASVFHSMRVAEHGLKALAKERKIVLRNKPIELAMWTDILTKLKKEAENIAQKSPSIARESALEFYNGALSDLNGFKDEYRNMVMHVRRSYDEHQALRAYGQVRAFMLRLSDKMDDRHYRIRWGIR